MPGIKIIKAGSLEWVFKNIHIYTEQDIWNS